MASAIKHVVIIVQENHAFDVYFGRYCAAAPGSEPSCTVGPACCEAAPDTEPMGNAPTLLDDAENAAYDPTHTQACELGEMDSGKMDLYAQGASCSDPRNFAVAAADVVNQYHQWAAQYALADRYFQPIVGQSSSNDMYLAVGKYQFTDNAYPPDAIGKGCTLAALTTPKQYTGVTTIADVLLAGGATFAFYAEGYAAMLASATCPAPPAGCPFGLPTTPCDYDPSDVPFEYYAQFTDNPTYMKDFDELVPALANGTLPSVAFVKGLGYHNEHPGYGTTISDGVAFTSSIVAAVQESPVANDTLVLITWDEGGGFFDHVTPPLPSQVDQQPYGTRVPLLAIGRFARQNHVSHVVLEHSSILKFIEYNFFHQTGQLKARDAVVNNLGSLLNPAETGLLIPEN